MPLKIKMEPQEWLLIGDTKIINVHSLPATFLIDGCAPILRQAHTLSANDADTAAKRTYLAVQRLYLGLTSNTIEYQEAAAELLSDVPDSKELIAQANKQLSKGSIYGALKAIRKLIENE